MASPSPNHDINNTTYVQADPSNFRAVVQRLTGRPTSGEMGPRGPPFKLLHERRQTARKLEVKLNNDGPSVLGPPGSTHSNNNNNNNNDNNNINTPSQSQSQNPMKMMMFSPVSPLDLLTRGSPRTPRSPAEEEEEEEKAIAEKGFYFHPSPLTPPRGSQPPQLLPLFPLHSPRDNRDDYN